MYNPRSKQGFTLPLILADDFTPQEKVTGVHILPAVTVNSSISFANISQLIVANYFLKVKLYLTLLRLSYPCVYMGDIFFFYVAL